MAVHCSQALVRSADTYCILFPAAVFLIFSAPQRTATHGNRIIVILKSPISRHFQAVNAHINAQQHIGIIAGLDNKHIVLCPPIPGRLYPPSAAEFDTLPQSQHCISPR